MTTGELRVYADTSVFGGCYDDEFADASREFFDAVRSGKFALALSAIIEEEIESAPREVRDLFEEMLNLADVVNVTAESQRLQEAYLVAGIVSSRSATDALHVALATTAGCKLIVSWNFRHIVHFEKIPLYNAVNVLNGHAEISIHSPREVGRYEDEDV